MNQELGPEDTRIVRAMSTGKCDCGGEIEYVDSGHERDSSNDRHVCQTCGWSYSEMIAWGLEAHVDTLERGS